MAPSAPPQPPTAQAPAQPSANDPKARLAVAVKQLIESGYRDGVDSIPQFDVDEKGKLFGKFVDEGTIYDFEISPNGQLSYQESGSQQSATTAQKPSKKRVDAKDPGLFLASLKRLIEQVYRPGIDSIVRVRPQPSGDVDGIFKANGMHFKFSVESGGVSYRLVDSRGDAWESGFAVAVRTDKKPQAKGIPCGKGYINANKECRVGKAEVNKQTLNEVRAQSADMAKSAKPSATQSDDLDNRSIRDLKLMASTYGVYRYSDMDTAKLKQAIREARANKNAGDNKRESEAEKRKRAYEQKEAGKFAADLVSVINPKLGNVVKRAAISSYKHRNSPGLFRLAMAGAIAGVGVVSYSALKAHYDGNVKASANDAHRVITSDDSFVAPNLKGKNSITFVAGSSEHPGEDIIGQLKGSKALDKVSKAWIKTTAMQSVPVTGEPEKNDDGSVLRQAETAFRFVNPGRNPDAINLAAQLYRHGQIEVDRVENGQRIRRGLPINLIGYGSGGQSAREAIDILKAMGKEGEEIAKRVQLVNMSSPYFGLAAKNQNETNLLGGGDPLSSLVFARREAEMNLSVQNVNGSKPEDYLNSSDAANKLVTEFRRREAGRTPKGQNMGEAPEAKTEKQQAKAAAQAEKAKQEAQEMSDWAKAQGKPVDIANMSPDDIRRLRNRWMRARSAERKAQATKQNAPPPPKPPTPSGSTPPSTPPASGGGASTNSSSSTTGTGGSTPKKKKTRSKAGNTPATPPPAAPPTTAGVPPFPETPQPRKLTTQEAIKALRDAYPEWDTFDEATKKSFINRLKRGGLRDEEKKDSLIDTFGHSLRVLLDSAYTDGIESISHARHSNGLIVGQFYADSVIYDFEIDSNSISFVESELQPRSDAWLDGYLSDSIYSAQRADKKPQCKSGKLCGNTCIAANMKCTTQISGELKPVLSEAQSLAKEVKGGKKARKAAVIGASVVAGAAILGAGAYVATKGDIKSLGANARNVLDQIPKIKDKALLKINSDIYNGLVNIKDIDKKIDALPLLSPKMKADLKQTVGATKVYAATELIKKTGGKVVSVDPKTNMVTMVRQDDKSLFSIGSVGHRVITFGSNFSGQKSGFDTFEMGFKIDESFHSASDDKLKAGRAENIRLLRIADQAFKEHIKLMPENALLMAEAFKDDSEQKGQKRQSLYEKVGFRPLNVRGNKLWAVKNQGQFTRIPDEQVGLIEEMILGRKSDSLLVDLGGKTRLILDAAYTDGIDAITTVKWSGRSIAGQFYADSVIYDFEIDSNSISFVESKLKPRSDAWLEGYLSDAIYRVERRDKQRNCQSGKPCGDTCIAAGLKCNTKIPTEMAGVLTEAQSLAKQLSGDIAHRSTKNKESEKKSAVESQLDGTVGVAALAVAGMTLAASNVLSDLEQSRVPYDSIRRPPNGVPDDKTMAKYETFKPGDLIRTVFRDGPEGRGRYHYGVYAGKDPKTGEHMVFESTAMKDSKGQSMDRAYIQLQTLNRELEERTEWEVVPPKNEEKRFPQKEILARAKALVGKEFTFKGFDSNCEYIARGLVTGNATSEQATNISPLTRSLASLVTQAVPYIKSPEYRADKSRMSASEAITFLNSVGTLTTGRRGRKDSDAEALSPSSLMNGVLATKKGKDPFSAIGLKSPEEFMRTVQQASAQYPGSLNQELNIQFVKAYLMVLMTMFSQKGEEG